MIAESERKQKKAEIEESLKKAVRLHELQKKAIPFFIYGHLWYLMVTTHTQPSLAQIKTTHISFSSTVHFIPTNCVLKYPELIWTTYLNFMNQ